MADYPIETRMLIDGVEAPADGPDLAAGKATWLDGLSFQWGRQSTTDQPDVNTCSFTLRQELRYASKPMLDIIHAGSKVELWSKATIPTSNSETMPDGLFDTLGALDNNRWTHVSGDCDLTVAKYQGRVAAWATGEVDGWASRIVFPPAQFQQVGIAPDSWDLIPKMQPGQTWQMKATVWVPPGAGGRLIAYAYTAPNKAPTPVACTVVNSLGQTVTIPADGAWHSIVANVSLPAGFTAGGAWIAPGVRLDPMPSQTTVGSLAGTVAEQPFTYDDYSRAGISALSLVTQGPSVRDVQVWAGEVTRAVGQSAGDYGVEIAVTASDAAAEPSNETVGDDPWPVQTLATRVARVHQLADTIPAPVVDASLRGYKLTYRDVDAQPVLGLLQDMAQSVGGVLWVATHATTGTYLWMEDPANRAAVRRFVVDPDTDAVTVGETDHDVSVISGADVLRDSIQWAQDAEQVITSVDVTWQRQGTDSDGQPTTEAVKVTQTDAAARHQFGLRKLAVETELVSDTDAAGLTTRLLAQARSADWMVSGLAIDSRAIMRDLPELDYVSRLTSTMNLLDGTSRVGRAMTLIDLPSWTPAGAETSVYLEGGTYTLADGKWQLELQASAAGGQGTSATFADFADTDVRVEDFDPSLTISDAYGVAAPAAA